MDYVQWIRNKVGNKKILLAYGGVVARDANGRFLLIHRRDNNLWGTPGGVLELDEDIESCARREVLEETGLEMGKLRLIGIQSDPKYDVTYPNGDQVQQFAVCFTGQVVGGILKADPVETHQVRFVEPGKLDDYPMAFYYRERIQWAMQETPPAFAEPYANEKVFDQIKSVRASIGTAVYIGIGATAVVVRGDGRLLLLQHVGEDGWRFPAGFADLGENLAYTAVREVREETGLHIQPQRIMAVYSSPRLNHTYPNGDKIKNTGVMFRAKLLGGDVRLDPNEVREMAWVLPEEVVGMVNGRYRRFFESVLNHLNAGYVIL